MTKSETKIGEYYSWYEHKEYPYCTIKYTDTEYNRDDPQRIGGDVINYNAGTFKLGHDGLFMGDNRDVRIATPKERAHLDACIKAGRYVSESEVEKLTKPEIINEYQIF